MRVALINNFPPGTGIGRYAFTLLHEMQKIAGVDCYMFCTYPHDITSIPEEERKKITFLTNNSSFPINRNLIYFYGHKRLPKDFDVYHMMNQSLGKFAAHLHPCVVSVYDVIPLKRTEKLPKEVGNQNILARKIYSHFIKKSIRTIKHADKIVCLEDLVKQEAIDLAGVDEKKIQIIHEGLDHDLFKVRDKAEARKKLGLDREKKIVLHVGNERDPRKNLDFLLHAYAKLRKETNDVILVRVGMKTDPVAKIISYLGLDVLYFSNVSDETLAYVYNAADVYVLPSLEEGTAWTPVEAMASGCPAVVSDSPGNRRIAGPAPLYADPADLAGFANSMKRLLTDERLRKERIPMGIEWSKNYSWEKCARELVKVYGEVINNYKGSKLE